MNTPRRRTIPAALALLAAIAFTVGCEDSYGYRVVSTDVNRVTISDLDGIEEQTLEVAADARITLDGQPAVLEELDPGDLVAVRLEERNGKAEAIAIKAKTKETYEAEQRAAEPREAEPLLPHETDPLLPEEEPLTPRDETPDRFPDAAPAPDFAPPEADPNVRLPAEEPAELPAEEPAEEPAELPADDEMFEGRLSSIIQGDRQFIITADNGDVHTFFVNDETKYMLDGEEATFDELIVGHLVKVTAFRDAEGLFAKTVEATVE